MASQSCGFNYVVARCVLVQPLQHVFRLISCTLLLMAVRPPVQAQDTDAVLQLASSNIEEIEVFGQEIVKDVSIGRNLLEADELGRSVQIIRAPLIENIKPNAIEDILSLSSNVAFLGDDDGRENSFVLRGFQSPPILRDGFRVETFGGIADPELYNVERIEVLKGPDSILYGESNPGGLINLHLKRPLSEDHAEAQLELGTEPSVSPKFDVGGGFGESVRYRVVGLYSDDDGWRDYSESNERLFLAPSISWAITDSTVLTVIAEITEDDFQADFGTAINQQGDLIADPEQVNNHPQDTIERYSRSIGFDLAHEIDDQWQTDLRARYIEGGYEYSALLLPFGLDQETLFYFRVPAQQEQDNDELALQLNLNGDFSFGQMRNRLSMGVDYRESTTENSTRFDPSSPVFLDWRNPDYSQSPPPASEIPLATGFYTNEDITRVGVFLQNHLNITEQLMLSLGVRFDDVERDPLSGSSSTAQDYDNTSGQIGVRYDLNDSVSLFANYSESFSPNFDLDKNNNVLEPETGDGYGLGIKGGLFGGRVDYSFAVFDITKNNVAIADASVLPTDPNPFGQIAQGEQTSQGVELDVSGYITEEWQVNVALSYSDTESENGFDIVGAPDTTFSLWSVYRLSDSWSVGGSLEYVGERLVTADGNGDEVAGDAVYLDTHYVLNAFVGCQFGAWKYQLNVSNLTDEEYVDAAWGSLSRSVHAGAPLQALFSVSYKLK